MARMRARMSLHGSLYSSVHFSFRRFDLSFARPLAFDESSVFRDRISRIRSKNTCKLINCYEIFLRCASNSLLTLSTFSRVFADVSTYGTPPHCCARAWHSDNGTLRFSFKSHLLPTNRNGMFSSFFTRKICSLGGEEKKKSNLGSSHATSIFYLPKFLSRLEALVVCDGEHAEESFAATEIVVADGRVVLLTSRVENVNLYFFSIQYDLPKAREINSSDDFYGSQTREFVDIPSFGNCRLLLARSLRRTHRT